MYLNQTPLCLYSHLKFSNHFVLSVFGSLKYCYAMNKNINKWNNPTFITISNIYAVYKSDGVRKDPFKVGTSKIEIFCGRTDTITFCWYQTTSNKWFLPTCILQPNCKMWFGILQMTVILIPSRVLLRKPESSI